VHVEDASSVQRTTGKFFHNSNKVLAYCAFMPTKRKLKIRFWRNATSALQERNKRGGELQIALLAKILAKARHSVTLVDSEFKEKATVIEGM
jgi:hypothetical protein